MADPAPYRIELWDTPGSMKEVKARWRGVYQFECGGSRRMLYEVDDSFRVVRIIYLGEHPEWGKSRPIR